MEPHACPGDPYDEHTTEDEPQRRGGERFLELPRLCPLARGLIPLMERDGGRARCLLRWHFSIDGKPEVFRLPPDQQSTGQPWPCRGSVGTIWRSQVGKALVRVPDPPARLDRSRDKTTSTTA